MRKKMRKKNIFLMETFFNTLCIIYLLLLLYLPVQHLNNSVDFGKHETTAFCCLRRYCILDELYGPDFS